MMPALHRGFDTFSIEILVKMLMYFHSELSEQTLVTEAKITVINQKGTPLKVKALETFNGSNILLKHGTNFTRVSSSFQDTICSIES